MASRFWLSRIKLLWTFVYTFLCEHKHSFLWDKCPRVNLLGHVVAAYMVFQETAKCFSRAEILKQIQTNLIKINSVHLLPTPISSRICSGHWWALAGQPLFLPADILHRSPTGQMLIKGCCEPWGWAGYFHIVNIWTAFLNYEYIPRIIN